MMKMLIYPKYLTELSSVIGGTSLMLKKKQSLSPPGLQNPSFDSIYWGIITDLTIPIPASKNI